MLKRSKIYKSMIEFINVKKTYGNHVALYDINLKINSGLIFALLGPNGSGKTTLLRSLMGLAPLQDKSEILVNKNSIRKSFTYRDEIGYMPQIPSFPRNLKVKEIIEFLINLTNKKALYLNKIKSDLGINSFADKQFGTLSQGMKQKVNILQCFMYDHNIIVIDEPAAGLDPQNAYYLKNLLRERKKRGNTILFTTHIMAEVEEIADEMTVLVDGKISVFDKPKVFIKKQKAKSLEDALVKYWIKQN
ncbi:MAG: ATP-binding cassette domain-containing protein [Spirochaetia bacterium]|nr:ATP-binding cassette domain-containing protein [Spirochaetia bacterium]